MHMVLRLAFWKRLYGRFFIVEAERHTAPLVPVFRSLTRSVLILLTAAFSSVGGRHLVPGETGQTGSARAA
jgi:hypothetical protein